MEKKYLIKFNDAQIRGPFSESQVYDMIYEHLLDGNELVCELPGGEWNQIGTYKIFYDVFLGSMENDKEVQRDDKKTFVDIPTQTNVNERVFEDKDATVLYEQKAEPVNQDIDELTELYNESDLRDVVKNIDENKMKETLDSEQKSPIIPQASIRSFKDKKEKKTKIYPMFLFFIILLSVFIYYKYDTNKTEQKKFVFKLQGLSIEKKIVRIKLPIVESTFYNPVESKKLINQSLALMRNDDIASYKKAEKLLHEAIEQDVSNKTIISYIAYVYFRLYDVSEKNSEYINALNAIVSRAKQGDYNIQSLGLAKIGLNIIKGDYNKAVADLNEILSFIKSSHNPELLILGAEALIKNGISSDAHTLLLHVNEQNSVKYPRAFYLDGLIKFNNNENQSAMESFKKALAINPNHTLSKSKLLEYQNNPEQIVSYLKEKGSELNHSDVSNLLFILGNRELALKQEQKAKELYRNALNFSAENKNILIAYQKLGGKTDIFKTKDTNNIVLSDEASVFLMRGDELFFIQKYRDASMQYRMAASLAPGSVLVWSKLGQAYRFIYELDNAVKALSEGLKIDSLSVDLLVKLAKVQTDLYNFIEADKNLKKALALDPDNPDTLFALGYFNDKRGLEEKAVEYYHKAVSNDFSHVDSLFELGKKSYYYESYEDSKLLFEKVVANQPSLFEAYMFLTRITAKLDHISKAEVYAKGLLDIFPNVAEIHTGLAIAYMEKLDFDSAEKKLKDALVFNRYSIHTLMSYSDLCLNLGKHKEALAYLETVAIIAPYKLSAIQQKIKIYNDLGQYSSAEKELVRLVSLTPYFPRAFYKLGELYFRDKKYTDAEEALLLEIQHNPAIRDSYILLGDVFILNNKLDKAQDLFRQMLSERPKDPYGLLGFAKACFAKNDMNCTETFMTQARHIDPNISEIYFLECQTYFKMNRFPESVNSCSEFLRREPNHFYAPQARETLSNLEKIQQKP